MHRAASFYEKLPKSQQVDVRRGRLGSIGLWQMLIHLEKDQSGPEKLRVWTELLIAMTNSSGYDGTSFGAALAKAGWSEMRLNQLLSAGPNTVLTELRRLGQYLKSKNQKADWNQAKSLAWAVHFGTTQERKEARLQVAQSYFSHKPPEEEEE